MEDEIDLRDIIRVLWKRRRLIIGIFMAAVLVAGVISLSMPSVYRISSIFTGGNFDDPVYTSQASIKNIMLSDEFVQGVFEQIRPNATESEFQSFKNSIDVEPMKGSDRLVEISVETKNKQEGIKIVEMMIQHYANRSEDSYNRQKEILSDQLDDTMRRLDAIDREMNQTQELFPGMPELSISSGVEGDLQFSRALYRLESMQTRRSALIDRRLELQKQLVMIRNLEVVLPATEPISPIGPRKVLIVAVAGMLGLMVGIFAAFLREWQGRLAE